MTIRIEQSTAQVFGRVEIRTRADGALERTVDGATCREVGEALALIVALALERRAALDEAPGEGRASEQAGAPGDEPPQDVGRAGDGASAAGRWAVGIQGDGQGGVAPWVVYGARMWVERDWPAVVVRAALEGGPAVSSTPPNAGGSAWFSRLGARLEVCPWRWRLPWRVLVDACGTMRAGIWRAGGRPNTPRSEEVGGQAVWLNAGVVGRAAVRLGGSWWIELQADVGAIVPRTRFQFWIGEVAQDVYVPPYVAAGGAVGFSYRFR